MGLLVTLIFVLVLVWAAFEIIGALVKEPRAARALRVVVVVVLAIWVMAVLGWIDVPLFAQAPTTPPQPEAPPTAHDELGAKTVTQIPLAIAIVKVIEFLKTVNLPGLQWLRQDSSRRLLQFVNVAAAFLATMGLTGAFSYADTGAFELRIVGNFATMGSSFFSFIAQWSMQQVTYDIHQLRNMAVTTHDVVTGIGTGDGGVQP